MKIIISPAKKMKWEDTLPPEGKPCFLAQSKEILGYLKSLDYGKLQKLWGINDSLMRENWSLLQRMDLDSFGSPAVLSYDGIQYTYMAPSAYDGKMFQYLRKHLRILSGFYGVLEPFDGVVPYRLEMQAKAKVQGTKDLYAYWGDSLYQKVMDDDHLLINLASEEYAKAVLPYCKDVDTVITPVFCDLVDGRPVTKGVYAKMARGEMVTYMAQNGITDVEVIKSFCSRGYAYAEEFSTVNEWVFLRNC